MEFTPQELWASTGTPVRFVIVVMLMMAVWCVYVAVERLIALGRARAQSRALAAAITGPMQDGDVQAALQVARSSQFKAAYLGRLLVAGLAEFDARPDAHGITSAERALERVSITEGADLRKGLNILATTGATSPFVGLVGTIFGIINAFQGMAESGSGGLASVSAGIAEALITTAIGIAVANIGVRRVNFFNATIEGLGADVAVL